MMAVCADVVRVVDADLMLHAFMPAEQIGAVERLTNADLRFIADLRGDLADEQGRLTAYWNSLVQGFVSMPESEKAHLTLCLSVMIEHFARLVLDAQHFAITQIGTALEVAGWIERAMTGLSDARAILSPQFARNDTSLVPGPSPEQEVA